MHEGCAFLMELSLGRADVGARDVMWVIILSYLSLGLLVTCISVMNRIRLSREKAKSLPENMRQHPRKTRRSALVEAEMQAIATLKSLTQSKTESRSPSPTIGNVPNRAAVLPSDDPRFRLKRLTSMKMTPTK